VLLDGVISPVAVLIVKPAVELYVPPVYAPVPFKVTDWVPTKDVQNGEPA
jgi:hypothetical protein